MTRKTMLRPLNEKLYNKIILISIYYTVIDVSKKVFNTLIIYIYKMKPLFKCQNSLGIFKPGVLFTNNYYIIFTIISYSKYTKLVRHI